MPLEQELTFSSSELTQCVNIVILPDDVVEMDERIIATLRSNDAVSIDPATATVVIVDSNLCML